MGINKHNLVVSKEVHKAIRQGILDDDSLKTTDEFLRKVLGIKG